MSGISKVNVRILSFLLTVEKTKLYYNAAVTESHQTEVTQTHSHIRSVTEELVASIVNQNLLRSSPYL